MKNFQNCKFGIFGQFGRPPRHKILGEIDPLGSISGEDKGGMGFPLALKNFLTLKIRPERSEGRKILKFDFYCLNKKFSKFFQFWKFLTSILAPKKQALPKQKTSSYTSWEKHFENFFKIENLGFWPVWAAAEA